MKQIFLLLSFIALLCTTTYEASAQKSTSISFTLHNSSARSIPLRIPGVMNPNLSPFSDSGVTLKVGQEIIFYPKGRKRALGEKQILLIVDESLDGLKLDVAKLIKEKKSNDRKTHPVSP